MSSRQDGKIYKRTRLVARFLFLTVFGLILPVAVVVAAYRGARHLMDTAPQAERRGGPGQRQARLVEVEPFERGDHAAILEAMGTVVPAREVALRSLVGGEVLAIHERLVVGGFLEEGETILSIDPSDYELAVRQREVAIAQAESNLLLEMGQQEIAREEFALLGQDIPEAESSLALRQPQLARARAEIEAAKLALDTAKLALGRTRLLSPLNSLVRSKAVERGTVVTPQTVVAELVGTDQFWIELAVTTDDLRWMTLPGPEREIGSEVRLFDPGAWGPGVHRTGRILRHTGALDERSRMTRVIAAVDDPLCLQPENRGKPQLFLNTYVQAEIVGRTLTDVVALPREFLREDARVWVLTDDNRLDVRPVEIAWRGPHHVLLESGIEAGEQVITTTLSSPVPGMALRTTSAAALALETADAPPGDETPPPTDSQEANP